MNEIMKFEDKEVIVEIINGEPMFEIYSVGMAIGHTKISKGKSYPRKERIDENIRSADISTVVHNGQQFITESQMYDFMLEARTDKCKTFRRWVVTEVLPQIRATGGYIPMSKEDSDLEIMSKAIMIAQRTIDKKDEVISFLQPKAEGYDLLMDSRNDLDFSEFVKSVDLKIGRNSFIDILRANNIIRNKPNTEPYQQFINAGYFRVIQTIVVGHSVSKTLITKKGADWLIKKCIKWELIK